MLRKFIALLILLATIGAMIAAYLYVFVYSTATLTIESDVAGYEVTLFAKKTAQKKYFTCPEALCDLENIAPLSYTLTISKDEYQLYTLPIQVKPHRNETIVVTLEKQPKLVKLSSEEVSSETVDETLERLRNSVNYYHIEKLDDDSQLVFIQSGDTLNMQYVSSVGQKKIHNFPLVSKDNIMAEYIQGTTDIFLGVGDAYYLYRHTPGALIELPYSVDIRYIKTGPKLGEYYIVTKNGTFLYNAVSHSSEYQYLFQDFVLYGGNIIGIVGENEDQKRKNFNYPEDGNLIVQYSLTDKTRTTMYSLESLPQRIENIDGAIVLTLSDGKYELSNF